jgi:hypothetical protein
MGEYECRNAPMRRWFAEVKRAPARFPRDEKSTIYTRPPMAIGTAAAISYAAQFQER